MEQSGLCLRLSWPVRKERWQSSFAAERGGYVIPSKAFAESLFVELGDESITGAHVRKVDPGRVYCETLDGETQELAFDCAMLLPLFAGVGLQAYDRGGADITSELFAPTQLMRVDADYTQKPYENW